MKKLSILFASLAFALTAGAQQHPKAPKSPAPEQAKKAEPTKPRQPGITLDKAKPTPHLGEGFLIHGREGKAMDAGRPSGTQPDWDLWRK